MVKYLQRLAELALVGFLGAGVPVLVDSGSLDSASLHGALSAGVVAVYGVLAKFFGDRSRPTVK